MKGVILIVMTAALAACTILPNDSGGLTAADGDRSTPGGADSDVGDPEADDGRSLPRVVAGYIPEAIRDSWAGYGDDLDALQARIDNGNGDVDVRDHVAPEDRDAPGYLVVGPDGMGGCTHELEVDDIRIEGRILHMEITEVTWLDVLEARGEDGGCPDDAFGVAAIIAVGDDVADGSWDDIVVTIDGDERARGTRQR